MNEVTEKEVLNRIASLLWGRELEATAGMGLLEKEIFISTEYPLGRAGMQLPDGLLILFIKGKHYKVSVTEIVAGE